MAKDKSESKYTIDFSEGKFTLTLGEKNDRYGKLTEVSFHKEIYQPGFVEFKVQVGTDTQDSCKGSVDLKYGEDIVAKNYYIFEKITQKEYVTYKAYSVDKFLTIEKFNYAHTGKRLVDVLFKKDESGNIVDENDKIVITNSGENKGGTPKALAGGIVFSLLNAPKKGSALEKFKELVFNKNNNCYVKNLNHLGTGNDEAILPYCVQYQESFFDFMVRICNRNGEFLYCENNEWHIGRAGIKDGGGNEITASLTDEDVQSEEKYESCIEIEGTSNLEVSNYLKENYVQTIMDRNETNPVVNNAGMLSEEYFESIGNGNYAHYSDYIPPLSTAFDMLKAAEERQNFFDAVAGTLVSSSVKFSVAGAIMAATNKKYSDYYDTLTDTENDGKKHEFTRTPSKVDATFYANILTGEEYAEKNKLILDFSTYRHLLLGQKVEYGEKNYVVYSVNGGITDDKTEYQTVTLVPVQGQEAEEKIYPLPLYDKHIKKASPQRAVVVFNFDPERLGRVRVKYPWQTIGTAEEEKEEKSESIEPDDKEADKLRKQNIEKKKKQNKLADATPWLRVSYPMASKESGFMFFPKERDEVLIDYEDGNIDRPFVAGSFYNKENRPSVPSATHTVGVTKSITSDNGHHISFTDLSGYKFISDIIPVPFIGLLSKFGLLSSPLTGDHAAAMLDLGKDLRKYLAGGFEIADYLGVYKIKGTTHERNITISSPVGDVVVDAFTGITIKAPHGDVNIVGKNVNIEARNNLTIQSGTNIKRPYFFHYNRMGAVGAASSFAAATTASVLKAIGLDLSFHRTWLEVLLRPIGGTMQIKSYRFMQLEAGVGETKIMKNKEDAGFFKKLKEGMAFRHAFKDNPLYTPEHWKRIVEDYNTSMWEVKELTELLQRVFLVINLRLKSWNNRKRARSYSKEDFEKSIKELVNLLSFKRCDDDSKGTYEVLNGLIETIDNKRKKLENKMKPLDSGRFKKIDGEISGYLKEVKDRLKGINYNDEAWSISKIALNVEADSLSKYRKGLFSLIENHLSSSDLKGLIKMDSTILGNDADWENAHSENWTKAIKVAGPPQIPQLEHMSKTDFAKAIGGTMLKKSAEIALDKLGFNDFMENDVWGQNDKGKILFSDVKGETYCLTKDGVKTAKHPGLDTIVDVIVKEISNYTLNSEKEFKAAQGARYPQKI